MQKRGEGVVVACICIVNDIQIGGFKNENDGDVSHQRIFLGSSMVGCTQLGKVMGSVRDVVCKVSGYLAWMLITRYYRYTLLYNSDQSLPGRC